jgi:hypothetical protein
MLSIVYPEGSSQLTSFKSKERSFACNHKAIASNAEFSRHGITADNDGHAQGELTLSLSAGNSAHRSNFARLSGFAPARYPG